MRISEAAPNHTPGEAFSKAAMDIAMQMIRKLLTKVTKIEQTNIFFGWSRKGEDAIHPDTRFFPTFILPEKKKGAGSMSVCKNADADVRSSPPFSSPRPWKTSKNVFEEIWSASVP